MDTLSWSEFIAALSWIPEWYNLKKGFDQNVCTKSLFLSQKEDLLCMIDDNLLERVTEYLILSSGNESSISIGGSEMIGL